MPASEAIASTNKVCGSTAAKKSGKSAGKSAAPDFGATLVNARQNLRSTTKEKTEKKPEKASKPDPKDDVQDSDPADSVNALASAATKRADDSDDKPKTVAENSAQKKDDEPKDLSTAIVTVTGEQNKSQNETPAESHEEAACEENPEIGQVLPAGSQIAQQQAQTSIPQVAQPKGDSAKTTENSAEKTASAKDAAALPKTDDQSEFGDDLTRNRAKELAQKNANEESAQTQISAVATGAKKVVAKAALKSDADDAPEATDTPPAAKESRANDPRQNLRLNGHDSTNNSSSNTDNANAGTPAVQVATLSPELLSQLASAADQSSAEKTSAEPHADKPVAAAPGVPITTGGVAQQHKTDSAESAATAQEPPPADPGTTFEQVVLGLRTKFDPKNGKAEIRLDPPNLGALHVSISLKNGALTAEFNSGSEMVRELLKTNMEKLKGVLEAQGVTVDKLAVQPMTEQGSSSSGSNSLLGQTNPDGRNGAQSGQDQRSPRRGQEDETFAKLWQDLQANAPVDVMA